MNPGTKRKLSVEDNQSYVIICKINALKVEFQSDKYQKKILDDKGSATLIFLRILPSLHSTKVTMYPANLHRGAEVTIKYIQNKEFVHH